MANWWDSDPVYEEPPEQQKWWENDPVAEQPSTTAQPTNKWWEADPVAEQAPPEPQAEGTIGTALRAAAHAALPSAAGLAGIPAGIATGAALGLPAGGWGAIPGGILGGIAGYVGGSKVQETALKAMGFDDSQQMAVNTKTNPKSALVGEIAGALPTVGVGAGVNAVVRAGGAIGGGLLEAGSQALGSEPWDPTRIGGAAVAGGLLTKPTRLGEAIGGGAARAIGRPELWHGSGGPDAAAGTAKEQPPPRQTPEAGVEVPTDYYAKPPRVTEGEAPPAAAAERPPQVFEGEAPAAAAQAPAPQVTPVDPAIDAAVNKRPIEPRVTEVEPPTKYGQMLDQEFPRVPQPQVIEGEAPAAAARAPEPRVFEGEAPPLAPAPPATPREAMTQRAPEETYGQVLRRLAADERGGGRIGAKQPGEAFTAEEVAGIESQPENMQLRLGQMLRDRAARKKLGYDVEGPDYAPLNTKIRQLRQQIKDFAVDERGGGRLPREAMAQRAPEETYGQVLRRLVADERGGGRLPPRKPPTEEPGAGPVARATDEAMPTPGVFEGPKISGTKAKANAALEARGFTPEQIAKMKPKEKTAILQKREGEVGSGPKGEAMLRREAEVRASPPAEALDLKLASRMVNQPAVLRSEAAKRGITPEALHAQATEALKTPALPGRPAEMSPVGGGAVAPAVTPKTKPAKPAAAPPLAAAAPPAQPPPPPANVGQAAAAAGGPPPRGPNSMVYVPPAQRSDFSELVRNVKLLVGADIGPQGKVAEKLIRGSYGEAQRLFEQATNLIAPHQATILETNPLDRRALMNRIEGDKRWPAFQPTVEQQRLISDHKMAMDLWKNRLTKLDRTKQMDFVQNYLPHMYENPEAAKKFFSEFGGRGGAGSTKKRVHPTFEDAIEAGLKPFSDNPIELSTRYGMSMKNFIASNDVIERALATGIAGNFRFGRAVGASGTPEPHQVGGPPPGWVKLNTPSKHPNMDVYAPEDFADKYNTFYSRGVRGLHAPIYDAMRNSNAAWTQLELGLNAYHFFTMANEAIISDVAKGFSQLMSGQFKKGMTSIAQSPLAPRSRYVEGKRFQQEYLDPNSTNPLATILAEANARPVGRSHALDVLGSPGDPNSPARGSFIKNFSGDKINLEFRKAWDEVKGDWGLADTPAKIAAYPFKQASRAIQTVSAPLFDKYIPALKAGAVHNQMEAWHEVKLAQDPTFDIMSPAGRAEAVAAASKIVDSTDNRFGEMIHDNLFMNKALSQSAMVAMRSFSWTVGAMREIAGGTYAAGKALTALPKGENRFSMAHPEYDPRIGYALAMPFVVATTSAIYQYLKAGELPESWRDLYTPRTGGTIPGLGGKGQVEEHALMPGFHKDVYGWLSHPIREGYAKLGGAPQTLIEQVTNEDWRGDPIYRRGADPMEHLQQRTAHVLSKLGPISLKNFIKGQPETSGISGIETALGFRAPGAAIQDPTQLENWMRVKGEREWEAKQRHARTEAKKYEPRAAGGQ